MVLTQKIGDNATHRIALTKGRDVFIPAGDYGLIFTLKANEADTDANAKIQKQSGIGITHSNRYALVALVPADTRGGTFTPVGEENPVTVPELAAGTYYWSIRAQHLTTEETFTAATGTMEIQRVVGLETVTSVPLYTTNAPAPIVVGVPGQDGQDGADGVQIVSSETPPTDTTVLWLDLTDGSANLWNGFYWVSQPSVTLTYSANTMTLGGAVLTLGGEPLTIG